VSEVVQLTADDARAWGADRDAVRLVWQRLTADGWPSDRARDAALAGAENARGKLRFHFGPAAGMIRGSLSSEEKAALIEENIPADKCPSLATAGDVIRRVLEARKA
jgi:hypothetical protein